MFSSTCRPLRTGQDITTMAEQAIGFALANRDPEVDPFAAGKHAAIMATGRSDYPSQINNVLEFPDSSVECSTPAPTRSLMTYCSPQRPRPPTPLPPSN